MKILYFVTQGEQGGAQKYIADLALGIKSLNKPGVGTTPNILTQHYGSEIFVATGIQKEKKDSWLFETLEKGGVPKENLFMLKSHIREISLLKDISGLFEKIRLIKQIKPDLIHVNSSKASFVGSLAGFLTGTKSICTVHGFYFLEPMNPVKKIIFFLLEFISSFLRDFTILVSEKDLLVGKKLFILRNPKKYQLIYNGIKTENLKNILSKEEAKHFILNKINKQSSEAKVVGTIANLYQTKGLEYFIDAAAKIQTKAKEQFSPQPVFNQIFVVIGAGPEVYKQTLLERVKKHGLENNFFFLGSVPEAYKYLKAFDVFVLSSVKEGLPYSILEAALAGVPVVATKVGGIGEIASHTKIHLVQSKNPQELSEQIQKVLEAQLETQSFPEIFKYENMLRDTEDVYQKIL